MKSLRASIRRSLTLLPCAVASLFLSSAITASADDYVWSSYGGTSGTWQDGGSSPLWYDSTTNTNGLAWNNALQNNAYFYTGGQTVTVTGTVSVNDLIFDQGSYVVTGGTISKNANTANNGLVLQDNNDGNVTIDSNLLLDTAGNTDRFNINNNGPGTITINGNITYFNSGAGNTANRSLIFSGSAGSTFIFNGNMSLGTSGNVGSIRFSEGSSDNTTLFLNGDYSGLNTGTFVEVPQGTVVLGTSITGTGQITSYGVTGVHQVLTSGSQTIVNNAYLTQKDGTNFGSTTLGQYNAGTSTFSGSVGLDNTGVTLTAPSGGRAIFSGQFYGHSPTGIVKTGAGTVELSGNNNNYGINNDFGPNGTVAADIQQGKLVISNTSGSAFGGSSGTVDVETGAILAGNGISTQAVVGEGPTSVLSPGDGNALGTLHLIDGVSAPTGLTMAFKISANGLSNDKLDLGAGDFSLSGPITVDFTSLGTVLPGTNYLLASGSGLWSDTGATFSSTSRPDGLFLDSFDFNPGNDTFSVEFKVAPEPATWALMGLGTLTLFWRLRRKTAKAEADWVGKQKS
jgi:hypothetical protein